MKKRWNSEWKQLKNGGQFDSPFVSTWSLPTNLSFSYPPSHSQPTVRWRSIVHSLYLFLFPHLTLFCSERHLRSNRNNGLSIDTVTLQAIDYPTIDTIHPFIIYKMWSWYGHKKRGANFLFGTVIIFVPRAPRQEDYQLTPTHYRTHWPIDTVIDPVNQGVDSDQGVGRSRPFGAAIAIVLQFTHLLSCRYYTS